MIGVVETWLNVSIYLREIELENYSCIRIDRKNIDKTKGGGILVYIRDNLIYNDLTDRYCPNIDYAWVKISENNGRNITLGIFYRPQDSTEEHLQFLLEHMAKYKSENTIIVGDFNYEK